MNFRLERVSANKALVKFNIVNSAEELCGTVSVPPSQEADLLRHWKVAQATTPVAKAAKAEAAGKAAIVAALRRGPKLSKTALLRS